ncbi:MAG: hypothetical protein WBD75_00890 [Phycisphaerae bacterium]
MSRRTRVAVIFIDRFAEGGYRFIPLRMGRLVSSRQAGERQFFSVALQDFVCPRDSAAFNKELHNALHKKELPRLTDGDPQNRDDGYYAIEGPDIFANAGGYTLGEDAWDGTVQQLYGTKAFQASAERRPVFCRCQISEEQGRGRPLKAKIRGEEALFRVLRGRTYVADLYYKVGCDEHKHAGLEILLSVPQDIRVAGNPRVPIDANSNRQQVPFNVKRHPEYAAGSLEFSFWPLVPKEDDKPLEMAIRYEVSTPLGVYVWVPLLVVLFAACSAFKGMDFVGQASSPSAEWAEWYKCFVSWAAAHLLLLRMLAEGLQVIAVLGMVRCLGNKFL